MSYEEFPVFIPHGEDHLFGIVCAPAGASESDMGVVLLTGGNYTRSHRNRMWVKAARALAGAGVPSIRVDYHGIGDSTGRARFEMEDPFDDDALAAADFLVAATGVSELTFLATCFGGRTAMAAGARHPRARTVTIFPVPLLIPRDRSHVPLRTKVKLRLRKWEWGKQFVSRPGVRRARKAAAARRTVPATVVSPRFKRDMASFLQRGEVRFIYGERSPALIDLRRLLAEIEPRLSGEQRDRIAVTVLPDCEPENFRTLEDQDLVVTQTVASVTGAPPAGDQVPARV